MLSDLNDYLLNDLSLLVIDYVKFSDKQLHHIINQPSHENCLVNENVREITREEMEKLKEYKIGFDGVCHPFKEDKRFMVVSGFGWIPGTKGLKGMQLFRWMANSQNVSNRMSVWKALPRSESKHSFHFHGSTIVVADHDTNFRVYDFDSDFT